MFIFNVSTCTKKSQSRPTSDCTENMKFSMQFDNFMNVILHV